MYDIDVVCHRPTTPSIDAPVPVKLLSDHSSVHQNRLPLALMEVLVGKMALRIPIPDSPNLVVHDHVFDVSMRQIAVPLEDNYLLSTKIYIFLLAWQELRRK